MVFSSNTFLFFFLPAVLMLYYLAPRRFRNAVLLACSLVFYGWGEPKYLLLMLAVIALNYVSGLLIARRRGRVASAKAVLVCAVAANLGLLAIFKYTGFSAVRCACCRGCPACRFRRSRCPSASPSMFSSL